MNEKELSVVLRELARGQKVGLCDQWYSSWGDDMDVDDDNEDDESSESHSDTSSKNEKNKFSNLKDIYQFNYSKQLNNIISEYLSKELGTNHHHYKNNYIPDKNNRLNSKKYPEINSIIYKLYISKEKEIKEEPKIEIKNDINNNNIINIDNNKNKIIEIKKEKQGRKTNKYIIAYKAKKDQEREKNQEKENEKLKIEQNEPEKQEKPEQKDEHKIEQENIQNIKEPEKIQENNINNIEETNNNKEKEEKRNDNDKNDNKFKLQKSKMEYRER